MSYLKLHKCLISITRMLHMSNNSKTKSYLSKHHLRLKSNLSTTYSLSNILHHSRLNH